MTTVELYGSLHISTYEFNHPPRFAHPIETLINNSVRSLRVTGITRPHEITIVLGVIGEHSTSLKQLIFDKFIVRSFSGRSDMPMHPLLNAIRAPPNLRVLRLVHTLRPDCLPDVVSTLIARKKPIYRFVYYNETRAPAKCHEVVLQLIASANCPRELLAEIPDSMCDQVEDALRINTRLIEFHRMRHSGKRKACRGCKQYHHGDATQRRTWCRIQNRLAANRAMFDGSAHRVILGVVLSLAPLRLTPWTLLLILDWVLFANRRGSRPICSDPNAVRKLRLIESVNRSYEKIRDANR
jgi:hypothetical protein